MKRTIIGLLIALAIILGSFGIYCLVYMQKQTLMDALEITDAAQMPDGGYIVSYDANVSLQDGAEPVQVNLTPADAAAVWRAMEQTNVRFIRARGVGLIPAGGYYYEVTLLDSGNEETVCAFGFNTEKSFLINGMDYIRSGESPLAGTVGLLFGQVEG